MLIANPNGHYRFLPGGYPYSSGVVADAGYEIAHVTLRELVPYRDGFDRIDAYLRAAGLPRAALCGIELRSPAPFTRAGFAEFNRGYRAILEAWELIVAGENPIARTNVAPNRRAPSEPSLYGFSYAARAEKAEKAASGPSFVVAGGGELRGGPLESAAVVRPGETGEDAMLAKAAYVLNAMARRLDGLGAGWGDVTATEVYTVRPLAGLLDSLLLDAIEEAAVHGIRWHYARPPIDELEFEMDLRGVRQELWL